MRKIKFKTILKSIVQAPIVRGIVKSLPFGNLLYEVGENVAGSVINEIAAKENPKLVGADGVIKPHNWVSIFIQFLCIAGIVYAFITKQITIHDVLNMFGFDVTEVYSPVLQFPVSDTLK